MSEITARLSTALAERYPIERHLGEGGMATVYLARDLKHDRPVAVKVLRPEVAAAFGAERFHREIKIAVRAPNSTAGPRLALGFLRSSPPRTPPKNKPDTLLSRKGRGTMRILQMSTVGLIVLSTSGCGAIRNGTTQTISAQSSPDAATISTTPVTATYTTPASMELKRKSSYTLTFEKEGYSSTQFPIARKMQAVVVVADIFLTGLIGVVVDAVTGGWYKLAPESASVSLTSNDGTHVIDVQIVSDGSLLTIDAPEPVHVTVQPKVSNRR